MKQIIASACLTLTFVFGLQTLGEAQRRDASKHESRKYKTANHPPKINSFERSAATVTIPCPWWDAPYAIPCTPSASHTVTLTTDAYDPDGDTLKYEYSVTGGQITGDGSSVNWDYYKLVPGSYTIKVVVSDQHGGLTSTSINITVALCTACDRFCPTLSMACPSEAEDGQQITFSVNISGGDPDVNLTYNWSVSAGTIIKGQGTPKIEVDTTSGGGKQLKATVKIDGLAPECDRERSCEVQIHKR